MGNVQNSLGLSADTLSDSLRFSGDGILSYGDQPLQEIDAGKLLELKNSLENTLSSFDGAVQTDGSDTYLNGAYPGVQRHFFMIFVYLRVIQEIEKREIIE